MPKQGVVSIGLQVSYKESLDKMLNDFRATLKQVSNDAERIKWDSNMAKSFEAIQKRIDSVETDFKGMFDELNGQKLSTEKFEAYQKEISSSLGKIETDIKGLTGQFENLGNNDYVSKMVSQFKFLQENIKDTQRELGKVIDFTSSSSIIDLDVVKQVGEYKKAIKDIQNLRDNAELPSVDLSDIEKAKLAYKELYDLFVSLEGREFDLQDEFDASSADKKLSIERELYSVRQQMVNTLESLQELYSKIGSKNLGDFEDPNKIVAFDSKGIDEYIENATNFIRQNEKMVESYKETQSQLDALVTEFKLKNGAIHVPIEIDKINENHKNQLMSALNKLQAELDKRNIIAKVKLTLDDGSSKGRKKNAEFDQQQKDGQKKPVADLSPSIAKAYREGAKIAEESVKAGMAEIQKAFKDVPVTFKPNTEAFKTDLKAMINDSLKAIAEDTSGIKVNEELEKLVTNLKEVSTSLSGNENFKFGLDEASIERITTAIKDMADMIQRAFGVASNDDIAAQWTTIESKFKGVAGEEGKLLKGNKEHKIAIQELAVEYKKYLDMGGKNDLSELTTHKQTVKNIATEYENLGKAAQEVAQKQEKVAKKPASTKVSSEEADAIKGITKQNKNLETQAGKTGTALDNEGKSAQSAAEKFRKLAKEKGAAVVANRELAKAAKETADALDREAKARKEKEMKPTKGAVNDITYADNFLKWQSEIKQSLADSGNYAEVYEAKISQASNGTVKFTAVIRDLDGNLKKFSANVNDLGKTSSPSILDMSEKQAADFEKKLIIAEKIREAIANMDGEEIEPMRLNRAELDGYVEDIYEVLQGLEKANKATYKLDLTSDGKLAIAIKEFSETGAEAKAFTAIIDKVDDIFEETADGIKVSSEKIQDALAGAFDSGKVSKSTKDFTFKAQDALNKFTLKHKGNYNWSGVAEDIDRLKESIAGIDSQGKLNEFKQNLSDVAVKLNTMGKDNNLGEIISSQTFNDIEDVRANLDSLFAKIGEVNSTSIRVKDSKTLVADVRSINGELHEMTVSLDSNGFARFVDGGIAQFARLKREAQSVFSSIKDMVRIYLSPQDFIRYFSQGFDAIKDIDVSMTELRKVSDATTSELASYFDGAVASAKKYGSSVNEVIAATADWARLSYKLPEAHKLAEVAVLYKNVGDGIDIEEANSSLISTLRGFQLEAIEAERIIDAFNEVSNNFAISSAGIGEALKRSAAAFYAANTDLNKSIALITATNEVLQNPEKVGTLFQTVSARIRGAKTELENMGEETEGMVESTSKLRALVEGMTGFDIMKDENTFKDIYEIILGIGKEWGKLTDIDQAALLEALAGKRQSNALAALLTNTERLEDAYKTAKNSAGSAAREQQKYTEGLQYSIDQLKAHSEEFWATFINTKDVKRFIDILNTLISLGTKMVDTFGSLPTVIGSIAGIKMFKGYGNELKSTLKTLPGVIKQIKGIEIGYVGSDGTFDSGTLDKYVSSLRGLSKTQREVALSYSGLDKIQQQQILNKMAETSATITLSSAEAAQALTRKLGSAEDAKALLVKAGLATEEQILAGSTITVTNAMVRQAIASGAITAQEGKQILTTFGLTGANVGLAASFKLLTASIWTSIKAIGKFLFATPLGWFTLTTTAVIRLASAFDSLKHKRENLAKAKLEKINEDIEEQEAEISSLETLQTKLEEAKGNKAELAKLQSELNAVIGETPGLINGEAEAHAKADFKLRARIETEKEYLKVLQQRKVDTNREIFNNNTFKETGIFGWDWVAADASGETMRERARWAFATQRGEPAAMPFDYTKDAGWDEYWNEQVALAQAIFADTVSSYEGIGGQDFINSVIDDAVRKGLDLDEVYGAIKDVMGDQELQDAANAYYEALTDPDGNPEEALVKLDGVINNIVATHPQLEGSFKDLRKVIVDGGNAAVESAEKFKKTKVAISDLAKASDNIKTISSAFEELSENGYITTKTLEELKTAVGMTDDEWEVYQEELLKAKVGSAGFNQIMTDMTHRILDRTFAGKDLSVVTKQEVEAILRENGVVNASAIAHEWLNRAKAKEIITSKEFEQGTELDINALIAEAENCNIAKNAYLDLIAKEILFNETDLSVKDKIKKLNQLALAAGLASVNVRALRDSLSEEEQDQYIEDNGGTITTKKVVVGNPSFWFKEPETRTVTVYSFDDGTETDSRFEAFDIAAMNNIANRISDTVTNYDFTAPQFSGGSGSGSEPDYQDNTEAIINRINLRSDELKQQEEYIQNDIEIAELEKDYEKQISLTNDLLATRRKRLEELKVANAALHEGAESLRNSTPQWNEEEWFDSQGNATVEYINLYNSSSASQQEALEAQFEKLESIKDAYRDNAEEIADLNKEIIEGEMELSDLYAELHNITVQDIEHARDMALETNPFADTTAFYKQLQDEYHKEAERLRALDPEKYKDEIQELQLAWWDAHNEIADWSYSNSERWINERNTYDDWDLYGDNEAAAWERVLKRFKTEFPNELETIKEIEENIFNARKDAMEKSIEDIENYIEARNTYDDWDAYGDSEVKAVQRQTKIIEDAYKNRLISYEEYIDRLEEQSQRIYTLGQTQVDKYLSNIDSYISARNHYNDWEAFGDSETNAIKRQLKILDEAYRLNLISLEEYTEKTEEYTQKLYSAAKNDIVKTISELVKDYEDMKNLESSQLESQKTLLQSYYNIINAVSEAQHKITQDLNASMTMYEYLNEETRELLFNQEDYSILSEELLAIQSAANELQKQYQEDILNANAETIAEITSQYQIQYETMMKQYEIAKAELEVAKKRQKLDNVLAERNTRMFINGQWQWVAKTQDVINAQNELADAEINKKKQEASLEQTNALNEFTAQINSLKTDLNEVRAYWSEMQEMLNGGTEEVTEALRQISEVSSPELKRVIEATGGSVGSFSESISVNTQTMSDVITENLSGVSYGISGFITDLRTYSDAIRALANKVSNTKTSSSSSSSTAYTKAQMDANSAAWHTATTQEEKDWLHEENIRLAKKLGLDKDDYNSGTGKWNFHADGTRYTPGGLTALGEKKEFEAYITKNGRLIPINQPTVGNIDAGGIVFNREQLANLRNLWDLSNLGRVSSFVSSSNANSQNTVVDNSIHINGMTISEKGNEDWINGLRRYVATHK